MRYVIVQSTAFAEWRSGIKDLQAATAIRRRLERAQAGNLGDVKPIREGVSEMRVDIGQGYRLYFTIRDRMVIFLLVGGTKSTQGADIRHAVNMAKEV
jgi:putative addiction module killer protein